MLLTLLLELVNEVVCVFFSMKSTRKPAVQSADTVGSTTQPASSQHATVGKSEPMLTRPRSFIRYCSSIGYDWRQRNSLTPFGQYQEDEQQSVKTS